MVARTLGVELGIYRHFAASMHIYESAIEEAEQYVGEQLQRRLEMPEMPIGDPWPAVARLLDAERRIRRGEEVQAADWGVQEYWADLIRLLQIFWATGDERRLDALRVELVHPGYRLFIESRRGKRPPRRQQTRQGSLPI